MARKYEKIQALLPEIHHDPKTVLWVMKKYDLLAQIRRQRKWIQMGQQVRKYENLLNRDFRADRHSAKWVTDISYIHTRQDVLYLSMIREITASLHIHSLFASHPASICSITYRVSKKQD